MNKIGVMTVARDEEATIAFTIGAAIEHVDKYVYIDTGSTDRSLGLVEQMFEKEIQNGKLEVARIQCGVEIHLGRQLALDILRDNKIDFFFILDGDDVVYTAAMGWATSLARQLPINSVNDVWAPSFELYQHEATTTLEWLSGILDSSLPMWQMTKHQGQPHTFARPTRIQNAHDAYAAGKWTDESNGLRPEGIFHTIARNPAQFKSILSAHYGWARPLAEKRAKAAVRYGPRERWSPRIETNHLEPHRTNSGLIPFTDHPAVFQRLGPKILEILQCD